MSASIICNIRVWKFLWGFVTLP